MKELYIVSEMRGVVTENNKPVSGAKITRDSKWGWSGKTFSDSAVTSEDGTFSLPARSARSFFASFLPHEASIDTTISIVNQEKKSDILYIDKRNYELGGEFTDKNGTATTGSSLVLTCDLNKEKHKTEAGSGNIFGICDVVKQ